MSKCRSLPAPEFTIQIWIGIYENSIFFWINLISLIQFLLYHCFGDRVSVGDRVLHTPYQFSYWKEASVFTCFWWTNRCENITHKSIALPCQKAICAICNTFSSSSLLNSPLEILIFYLHRSLLLSLSSWLCHHYQLFLVKIIEHYSGQCVYRVYATDTVFHSNGFNSVI